ncbi:MAG: hypothetical protein IPN71_21615 [Fibrobacteres bacterium]|nr:hypothetical protein [Fibrobacterota bacterium]
MHQNDVRASESCIQQRSQIHFKRIGSIIQEHFDVVVTQHRAGSRFGDLPIHSQRHEPFAFRDRYLIVDQLCGYPIGGIEACNPVVEQIDQEVALVGSKLEPGGCIGYEQRTGHVKKWHTNGCVVPL